MQNLAFGGLIAWQRAQVVPKGPLHEAHQRLDPSTGMLHREQHGTAMVRSSLSGNSSHVQRNAGPAGAMTAGRRQGSIHDAQA